jgi:hypothetical protein
MPYISPWPADRRGELGGATHASPLAVLTHSTYPFSASALKTSPTTWCGTFALFATSMGRSGGNSPRASAEISASAAAMRHRTPQGRPPSTHLCSSFIAYRRRSMSSTDAGRISITRVEKEGCFSSRVRAWRRSVDGQSCSCVACRLRRLRI